MHHKLVQIFALFLSILFFSQSAKKDTLYGDFTYSLKAKLNTQTPDYIYEESFSLQIGKKQAFFVSTQSIKRDSVFGTTPKTNTSEKSVIYDLRGMSIPKTRFSYTIIQSIEDVKYFQLVGMSVLSYKEPVIKNWKLINESKVINTINCKKAEVTFKGRNWIAWYSPEIPFPYGPYKFSGLPGLIVKITDDKGEYDFELVKSVSSSLLKGKLINIKKSRYNEAIETTQPKLEQSLKTTRENADAILASYGTTIIKGQEIVRQRLKEREENRKYENPLELSN